MAPAVRKNSVNTLTWNVPIANPDGTPTDEFMRKWGQQAAANAAIPNLTTAAGVSSYLDLLGAVKGSMLYRGTFLWTALPGPGLDGWLLNFNGTTGVPEWRIPPPLTGGTAGQVLTKINAVDFNFNWQTPSSGGGGASSFWIDVSGNYYVALVDSSGQMVLDSSGNAVYDINPAFKSPATPSVLAITTIGF